MDSAAAASARLYPTWPHQLLIFTGPYLPVEQMAQLEQLVRDQPQIILRRYTAHFLRYMKKATLSLSMAGYNTCMDIFSTKARALVLPFTGGDNNEQTIRANKLAAVGALAVLQPTDLAPARLATKIQEALQTQPAKAAISLRGVEYTTALLTNLLPSQVSHPPSHPHSSVPELFSFYLKQFAAQFSFAPANYSSINSVIYSLQSLHFLFVLQH